MDYSLNEQQEMMQTLARDFMADEYPEKTLRAVAAGDAEASSSLWKKMAGMNLMGLSLPEEYGGLGDFLDLTVVLEEMGKACFISPFFSSVVLGASAITAAGTDEQKTAYLPGIAEGKIKATVAVVEQKASYTADDIRMKAEKTADGYVLTGGKLFVPYAGEADYIICAAKTGANEEDITLFIVPAGTSGVSIEPMKTVSGEKLDAVTCTGAAVETGNILGEPGNGWQHVETIMQRANVALCAGMAGLARRALDLTLEYAKERIAFGHPIGAFQSIQHRCADMLIDTEGSRFATYQAAWKLAEGLPAEKEVAIAKAWVSRACRRVMHSAHQVHGAIGFSEEHILHYYIKAARAYEAGFGGPDYHYCQLVKLAS